MSKRVKMTVRPASADHPLGIRAVGRWWNGDAIHLSGPAVIRAEKIQVGRKTVTNVNIELPSGSLINVTDEGKQTGPFTIGDLRKAIAGLPTDMVIDLGGAEAVFSMFQAEPGEKLAEARPAEPFERPKARPVTAQDGGDEDDGSE